MTDLKTNDETNTFPVCLFVLSEQLDLSLNSRSPFQIPNTPTRLLSGPHEVSASPTNVSTVALSLVLMDT
jgi:hypothetical protein